MTRVILDIKTYFDKICNYKTLLDKIYLQLNTHKHWHKANIQILA